MDKHSERIWSLKETQFIWMILAVGFILRAFVLLTEGNRMTLFSDDQSYISTAIEFLKSGHITYESRAVPTVFSMPGMPLLLSAILAVTGYTEAGLLWARVPFILMGTASIYVLYLIVKQVAGVRAANFASLIQAIFIPYFVMDNLFMTETPVAFFVLLLTYSILRFCEQPTNKNFLLTIIFYLCCLMFKPVVGIYPLAFVPYALHQKVPLKLLLKRGVYAGLIVLACLTPWWLRNYIVVNEFVPFTGNQGDTLLLGTFEGIGYPVGTYEELNSQIRARASERGDTNLYYAFRDKGIAGKERMKQWFETHPKAFVYSYIVYKPWKALKTTYYPLEVYNLPTSIVVRSYRLFMLLAVAGVVAVGINFRNKKQFFGMLSLFIGFGMMTYINTMYLAYPRYMLPWLPLAFAFGGVGIRELWKGIQKIGSQIRVIRTAGSEKARRSE